MTAASRESAKVRLRQHFAKTARRIAEDFASNLWSGSPEAVATGRENALRDAIERFLPRSFATAKGKIHDLDGGQSASIDIVVLAANHPRFRDAEGQIDIILADGVHCAIEVKPDITDLPLDFGASRQQPPELVRGLQQIASVKRLARRSDDMVLPPIPAYIVTGPVQDLRRLTDYVACYYRERSVPMSEQVDAIFALGFGAVLIIKDDGALPPRLRVPATISARYGEDTFAGLLLRIAKEQGPEPNLTSPLLRHYIADFEVTDHYAVSADGMIVDIARGLVLGPDGRMLGQFPPSDDPR